MRFAVFHLLLAAFLVWRAVLPLEARRGVKALLSLLIFAAASFSFWTAVCFGGLLSPELPRSVLIAGNALEAFVVFLALIALLREAVIFITVMLGRMGERAHRAVQKDRRALLGMAAGSARPTCATAKFRFRICLKPSRDSPSCSFPTFMRQRFSPNPS